MKPRVFIPQVPMRIDPRSDKMAPKFDTLEEASEFGDLVILVDQKLAFAGRSQCIAKIAYELRDYDAYDLFLPMGSHYFMMVAAIIISNKVNAINMLEWSSRDRKYVKSATIIGDLLLSDISGRR